MITLQLTEFIKCNQLVIITSGHHAMDTGLFCSITAHFSTDKTNGRLIRWECQDLIIAEHTICLSGHPVDQSIVINITHTLSIRWRRADMHDTRLQCSSDMTVLLVDAVRNESALIFRVLYCSIQVTKEFASNITFCYILSPILNICILY